MQEIKCPACGTNLNTWFVKRVPSRCPVCGKAIPEAEVRDMWHEVSPAMIDNMIRLRILAALYISTPIKTEDIPDLAWQYVLERGTCFDSESYAMRFRLRHAQWVQYAEEAMGESCGTRDVDTFLVRAFVQATSRYLYRACRMTVTGILTADDIADLRFQVMNTAYDGLF